jgi:hypothetical protein
MTVRQTTWGRGLLCAVLAAGGGSASGQTGGVETFTGTATVKSAAGAEAGTTITVVVERVMPQSEADGLAASFKTGGVAALKKALVGVAPTGSIRLGGGQQVTTRLTIVRETGEGRLLTIVSDTPVLFLGGNKAGAAPRAGYDFAVLDLSVDTKGNGSGTLAPAAKVTVNQGGAFVVQDYGAEVVRVTGVTRAK